MQRIIRPVSQMALVALAILMTSAAQSAVILSQNFDSMGAAGTAPPVGWTIGNFNPVTNQSVAPSGAVNPFSPLVVADGTNSSSGSISLNLGTTGATDRALGNFPSTGGGDRATQVAITNTAGGVVDSFSLSYKGEEWRVNNLNTANSISVFYSTAPGSGFVQLPASFTFTTPVVGPTSPLALDGNLPANSATITGVYTPAATIAPGATFYLTWYDLNDSGTLDYITGIDDVVVDAHIVPEPSSLLLVAVGLVGIVVAARRRQVEK